MRKEAKVTGMWVIYVISAIVLIYGIVCLTDAYGGYRVDEDELVSALKIIGYSVVIDLWAYFSLLIYAAGVGKGYTSQGFFWCVFIFPILGIPFLAIAPDLVLREEINSLKSALNNNATAPNSQPYVQQQPHPQVMNNPQVAQQPAWNNYAQPEAKASVTVPVYNETDADAQNIENAVRMCAKFALSFTTDAGMVRYVKKISKEPEVGEAFKPLLELEPAEMCTRLEELAK